MRISIVNSLQEECFSSNSFFCLYDNCFQIHPQITFSHMCQDQSIMFKGSLTILFNFQVLYNLQNITILPTEGGYFFANSHKSLGSNLYDNLIRDGRFSDVIFLCGGKTFNLHKNILAGIYLFLLEA